MENIDDKIISVAHALIFLFMVSIKCGDKKSNVILFKNYSFVAIALKETILKTSSYIKYDPFCL